MQPKPKRGFSLLEVLLGSILFSSIVIFMANIWGIHARVAGHSRTRVVASFIASQRIETCITMGFHGVDVLAEAGRETQTMHTTIRGVTRQDQYHHNVTVQQHDDPALRGRVKVVTVTVEFEDSSDVGNNSEVVYRTIIGES
jgi:Tfp pilus assembly protein PilV